MVNEITKLLITHSISKEFNGVYVLNDVDFDLQSGEIHSIIGENGAGKSTFIKILSGVYSPSEGEILIEGEKVNFKNVEDGEKAGIRTIHQEINLIPFFDALENIFLGNEVVKQFLGIKILDRKKMFQKALPIIQRLNVDLDLNKCAYQLNTAMQKVIQICKALVYNPKIVIFDEPTTSLGENERRAVLELIKELKKTGIAVIFISHNLDEVLEVSDRITVFRDGKKVGTISGKEATIEDLVSMMLGERSYFGYQRKTNKKTEKIKLEVKNLCTEKLHNINFQVYEGEVIGIAGITGAGKTEIAKAIYGIDPIRSGEIFLDEKLFKPKHPADSAKRGLAFIPENRQEEGLVLNMNVRKNITLSFLEKWTNFGVIDENKEKNSCEELINYLNIKCLGSEQIVKFLSGGNQQKVVVARWLSGDFEVGIFDEPTNGIDVKAKEEIYSLINEISSTGKGVIFFSSYIPELMNITDRILVIRNGQITGSFDSQKSEESEIMAAMLGGKKYEN